MIYFIVRTAKMINKLIKPKIAIVHDYLRTYGGGERVIEVLHDIWVEAPIFVATADYKRLGIFAERFKKMIIHTSWVQKIPFFVSKPLLYRIFLPFVWSSFNFSSFDVVISSSGSNMAKGIKVSDKTLHICYCYTPPKFLYGMETESPFSSIPLLKLIMKPICNLLKIYDFASSQRVNFFIATSKTVALRIRKFYKRNSIVIYPPCLLQRRVIDKVHSEDYYLVVSRLVKPKHVDLVVRVANKLKVPLKVIGTGSEEKYLRALGGPTVEFLGQVDDEKLSDYYQNCEALIVATKDEDFGIAPIEAMNFGRPVVAYNSGGLRETVIEGRTGVFFHRLTERSLILAIKKLKKKQIRPEACLNHAEKFSEDIFKKRMKDFVNKKWQEFLPKRRV